MMTATLRFVLPCVVLLLLVWILRPNQTIAQQERLAPDAQKSDQGHNEKNAVNIHYLEIVTPKVDETCDALEKTHGVTFGKPIAEWGNARTTKLKSGGRIGVRAPMRETEEPVVRPGSRLRVRPSCSVQRSVRREYCRIGGVQALQSTS